MSIKKGYNFGASQYDENPLCGDESLGSTMEKAVDGYLLRKNHIRINKETKVFDDCCGTGRVSKWYAEKGAKVVGADFSESMVREAKKKNPDIEFRTEDARNLAEKDKQYDLVTTSWAMNHLPYDDREKALGEAARILKRGGYLLLNVAYPDERREQDELYPVRLFKDEKGNPVTMEFYAESRKGYVNSIKKAGFEILDVSEHTLGELEQMRAVKKSAAKRFSEEAKRVKVNYIILARKK